MSKHLIKYISIKIHNNKLRAINKNVFYDIHASTCELFYSPVYRYT